ncbi:MAG: AI-2E family transporter [Hyphomicrobiales bacterium]|nr:MAG: AI-2E family transporter [Hyphomicrobiales bacterium]
MTLRTQVLIWVGFTVVVVFALWLFRPILLPFVVGIALAYILNPLVNLVERLRIGRGWATAIVLLGVIGAIIGVFFIVAPLIISQIGGLALRLPGYFGELNELVRTMVPQLTEWLGPERTNQLQSSLAQFLGTGVEFIGNLTAQVLQSGITVFGALAFVILTPVVAFYLLLDWEGMVKGIDDLLPREHRREVRTVIDQIDRSMAGVFRGQGSVILVLTIYYTTALTLTGLNFGLVIGLITGLFSFVPFFGFLTGFTLSMGIALVQFSPNWWFVVIVFLVYMVGQFLEGNVLYPKLVGQSININPVWLMFALFAFGLLFGFVGLILAVPLAAITATLTRYAVKRYKESALYNGERPTRLAAADGIEPEVELAMAAAAPASPASDTAPASRRRKRLTPEK